MMPSSILAGAFYLLLAGPLNPGVYFPVVGPPAELPGFGDPPGGEVVTSMRSSDPRPVLTEWLRCPQTCSGDTL